MSIINKMHQDFQNAQQENPILARMPEKKSRKKILLLSFVTLLVASSLGLSFLIFKQSHQQAEVDTVSEDTLEAPLLVAKEKINKKQDKLIEQEVPVTPIVGKAPSVEEKQQVSSVANEQEIPVKKEEEIIPKANKEIIKVVEIEPVKVEQEIAPPLTIKDDAVVIEKTIIVKDDLVETPPQINTDSQIETAPQVVTQAKPINNFLEIKAVTLSNDQLAKIHLKQAVEAEKKGDLELAIKERILALNLQPKLNEERKSLALYYYGQGEIDKVKKLLQSGVAVSPEYSDFSLMLSKIALKEGNSQMAYFYLQQHPPKIDGHLDYYISYAILARKLHQHKQAELLYKQLLLQQPNNGRWLMSLAIAQDKQLKVESAINSYKHALLQTDLSLNAKDYINQRLSYLEETL